MRERLELIERRQRRRGGEEEQGKGGRRRLQKLLPLVVALIVDSGQWHVPGWSFWRCSSRLCSCRRYWAVVCAGWFCWLRYTSRCALLPSCQCPCRFHQVQFLDRLFRLPMKSVAFPQVAALEQGVMPVVVTSGAFGETAQKTVEIPQLPFFDKLVQVSVRGAEGRFPWSYSGPRCSASWPVWTRWICSACARLVLLGLTTSLALCSSWLSQAQDARHHGRHGPQGQCGGSQV